ncbi:hypothetical protein QP928_05450 [Corynebacterium propinquum]|nr:hypothetical protein [Corynebacterium propinquum]MDK8665995.1 hypothetical protein [Corynebacterium propinquum]
MVRLVEDRILAENMSTHPVEGDRAAIQAGRQAIANFIVTNGDEISPHTSEYEVMLVSSAGYAQDEEPVFYYRFTVRNGIADAPPDESLIRGVVRPNDSL